MGFCGSGQQQQSQYKTQDPLFGQQAQGLRTGLFNYLGGTQPQSQAAAGQAASGLTSAAANPAWNAAQNNATSNIEGNNLYGNPALDRQTAVTTAAAVGQAQDQNARAKSSAEQNGMGFSTGNQQAAGGNVTAAMTGAEDTNANTYLQNYLSERANQNQGGQQLNEAITTPLNYLTGVSSALTAPATAEESAITPLATNGQVVNTSQSGAVNPSTGADIMNGMGATGSMLGNL